MVRIISLFVLLPFLFTACSSNKMEEKGFAISSNNESEDEKKDGISKDSLQLVTRPGTVLLTHHQEHRLVTVFKLNKRKKRSFIGSNSYHTNYNRLGNTRGNEWNYNYVPGLKATYGYNMVNVSHYDVVNQKKKNFFESPVLIKTLYFPAFTNDTLFGEPIVRDYYMVSVYDEDTNKDNYINLKDLRRFFYFDINSESKQALLPANYSAVSSEYDPVNDYMYVFARLDENNNGTIEVNESSHVFWLDLKDPTVNGKLY